MSRAALIHQLRALLRKYTAKLADEVEADKITSVKQRLEQMIALIEAVGEYER